MTTLTSIEITQLNKLINTFIDDLYDDYLKTLSKLIHNSYDEGIKIAERDIGKMSYSSKQKIRESESESLEYVKERIEPAFETMYKKLSESLEKSIRRNYSLEQTIDVLTQQSKQLEKEIPFDNVGMIIDTSEVVDGILIHGKKTITQPKTLSVKQYSDYISRNIAKQAYLFSKINGFSLKGYNGFKYITKHDGKVRPAHKALHNRKFEIGTDDALLAIMQLLEPGCRCDIVPIIL